MVEELWRYYFEELNYLRQQGADFAERHPKEASHLGLQEGRTEDPHVARLLEGVAFLTARIQGNLDNGFPELTQALMGLLYPDFHASAPSQCVVRFDLIEQGADPQEINAGNQLMITKDDEPCHFTVCDTTRVLPIDIREASWQPLPTPAPPLPTDTPYRSVFRCQLAPSPNADWSTLDDAALRFYLSAPDSVAMTLYQALLHQIAGVVLEGLDDPEQRVYLPPSALQPYGFDRNHAHLDGRSSVAHHQLTDFFHFNQRFLFVELQQLINPNDGVHCWSQFANGFTLYIYSDREEPLLASHVDRHSMALGCATAINQFQARIEPIAARDIGIEVPLHVSTADSRHADICRVLNLSAHNGRGEIQALLPFYSQHAGDEASSVYWTLRRERDDHPDSKGMKTYVSLVDHQGKIIDPHSDWMIEGEVLCMNRDLPYQLDMTSPEVSMALLPPKAGVQMTCVVKPTPPRRPKLDQASRWQLVSQLSLQSFVSPPDTKNGLELLQDTLRLYGGQSKEHLIRSLKKLVMEHATTLIHQGEQTALCRGTHVHLTLDVSDQNHHEEYLLGALLHRFFAALCSINTFVQLSLYDSQQQEPLVQWPPLIGNQAIL